MLTTGPGPCGPSTSPPSCRRWKSGGGGSGTSTGLRCGSSMITQALPTITPRPSPPMSKLVTPLVTPLSRPTWLPVRKGRGKHRGRVRSRAFECPMRHVAHLDVRGRRLAQRVSIVELLVPSQRGLASGALRARGVLDCGVQRAGPPAEMRTLASPWFPGVRRPRTPARPIVAPIQLR